MYYLFRFHHIQPFEFMHKSFYERQVLYAFMRYELEQRIEENKPQDE